DRAKHDPVDDLLGEIIHALPLFEHPSAKRSRFAENAHPDDFRGQGPRQPERRVRSFNSGNPGAATARDQPARACTGYFRGGFPVATAATTGRRTIIKMEPARS